MRFAENTQHDTSKVLRLLHKMTSEVLKVWSLPRKMQRIVWKRRKSIACACNAQRLLTRLETCWNVTKCHACHAKRHYNLLWNLRQGKVLQLPPQTVRQHHRSQRLETRHDWASKRAFRARLPQISHFAASKSTFSYEFSYGPTSKSTFRARLPSIFMTCQKMPRLPRNLHLVTTSRSPDNAICKKHATRHVESAAPATQNHFWHVMKHVGMSRSATPATRNEATRSWKTPKVTPFAELTIGTAIWSSHGRLRTVANVNATSGERSSTPTPPEWNGNPCYAFGKNRDLIVPLSNVLSCQASTWTSGQRPSEPIWAGMEISTAQDLGRFWIKMDKVSINNLDLGTPSIFWRLLVVSGPVSIESEHRPSKDAEWSRWFDIIKGSEWSSHTI